MKKTIAILMMMVFIVGILSGCGKNGAETVAVQETPVISDDSTEGEIQSKDVDEVVDINDEAKVEVQDNGEDISVEALAPIVPETSSETPSTPTAPAASTAPIAPANSTTPISSTSNESSATSSETSNKSTDNTFINTSGNDVSDTTEKQTASVLERIDNGIGLTKFSEDELMNFLYEYYPGDNLTDYWIRRLPAETIYSYLAPKYDSYIIGISVNTVKAIDDSTLETVVSVSLENGEIDTRRLRLKLDNNKLWSVAGDSIVE